MPLWAVQLACVLVGAAVALYGVPLALGVTVGILERVRALPRLREGITAVLDPQRSSVPAAPADVVPDPSKQGEDADQVPRAHGL